MPSIKIPLKQFAYAFHSECGIVLENEGLKGNILYGTNFSTVLKNGKLWENRVLNQFNPLLYWNLLPFANEGNTDLNSTLKDFINYIKNFPHGTFYIYGVPIDIRGIIKNLSLNRLEKKYISRFSPKVFIDLLEIKKEGDNIVLTLYEIKSSSRVKPYHVVQASFYAFLLEELFKTLPVEVSSSIKIIFRQPQGYKVFEKHTADKRKLFNSFLQKAEDYLQTASLTPFVKFICVERDCQLLNDCYGKAVKNLSISLFKSLKHEGQKLFQSAQIDTAKDLRNYLKLLKQLQQPLGFEEEAFNTEYDLYKKEGVACDLDGCNPSQIKAKQWGRNFLGTLLADNILYVDLLYGDVAPLGVILILLTPENSNLDLLYTNNPKIKLNGVNIYPLVFDFSCQRFSYEGNVWRRFKQFFLQLLLFRRYPLSVIFRNEEAQKGLETLIYGELNGLLKRTFENGEIPHTLGDLMDVWRILKGIDYSYNIDKKLRVYILEELIGQIWQTNEPFNFKLPSFIAIAKLFKNGLLTFKGVLYKKFGCQSGKKKSLSEVLKINLSEEKVLSDCYHPLAPFRPSCIGLEEDFTSYKVDPKLWDYLILTGLWGLYDLFLGLKASSNPQWRSKNAFNR